MKRLMLKLSVLPMVAALVVSAWAYSAATPSTASAIMGCGPVYNGGWFSDSWKYCEDDYGTIHCYSKWYSSAWHCNYMY